MRGQKKVLAVAITTVLSLAGCGSVEQDKGQGIAGSFNARIVDGYVAGALVYVDSNDNGVLDAWEERAFTDRDGLVSTSIKGKNYCADGALATDAVHCLKVRPSDNIKLRARGGYDMSTGEPFYGSLSLVTTSASGGNATSPVVASPLTTLLAMDAIDKQAVATKLGLTLSTLVADFIPSTAVGTTTTADQRKVLKAAMQIHKLTEVISGFLTEAYAGGTAYSGLGKNAELPRDASDFIYQAIAEAVAGEAGDVGAVVGDVTKITAIITAAQTKIKARIAVVTKKTIADIVGDSTLLSGLTSRIAKLANLGSSTATLFAGASELSTDDVTARLRAINVIVSLARDKDVTDVHVQDAIDAAADGTYVTSLKSPKVDLAVIVKKFKTGASDAKTTDFASRVTIDQALKIGDTLNSTTKLSLDSSKGNLAMDFKTTAVDPDSGKATAGELVLDVASFSGSDFFKKDATTSTDPNAAKSTVMPGTWEKLNDYSLLVTIEPVPGVKQQAVVKPTIVDGVTKYFFDYGGKQIEWGGAVPTN